MHSFMVEIPFQYFNYLNTGISKQLFLKYRPEFCVFIFVIRVRCWGLLTFGKHMHDHIISLRG